MFLKKTWHTVGSKTALCWRRLSERYNTTFNVALVSMSFVGSWSFKSQMLMAFFKALSDGLALLILQSLDYAKM